MNYYILQEKQSNDIWLDLYSNELYILKKMLIIMRKKNIDRKYRIVRLYV